MGAEPLAQSSAAGTAGTRSRGLAIAVAALLLLHGWSALRAAGAWSPTYDEPLHLTAGYTYWTEGDFRLQPENGNLPQRWAALPLLAARPALPVAGYEQAWQASDMPRLMTAFLHDAGNDSRAMLMRARAAALCWSLALALLVFAWSRRLWGDAAGLFALSLYALSPTLLAHAPLVTSDMAGAFWLLAATGAYWRHLQRLSAGSLALSAGASAAAVLAKFSFVVLPPVFLALGLWRVFVTDAWMATWRGEARPIVARGRRGSWLALSTVAHLAVVWLAVWAAFGFRYAPAGAGLPEMATYLRDWSQVLPADGPLRWALLQAREWQVLPEAFLHGFSFVYTASQERAAFLAGEFRDTGWWWFFPYAFAVKSSVAELLLAAVAAGLVLRRRRDARRLIPAALLPLLALAAAYGLLSLSSNLNIGHRHLLPLYPVLLILGAGVLRVGAARWRTALAAGLLGVAVVEHVAIRPHYLSFFNVAAGGPANGWRHLVDSSLDWGQEAYRVGSWLERERRPDDAVYASLFGVWRPEAFGIVGTVLSPEFALEPRPFAALQGGVYAVSATQLQNVYGLARGRWSPDDERGYLGLRRAFDAAVADGRLAPVIQPFDEAGLNAKTIDGLRFARLVNYLRLREPDAVIAHSVFIHRLGAEEAAAVDRGDTRAYVTLLERATIR